MAIHLFCTEDDEVSAISTDARRSIQPYVLKKTRRLSKLEPHGYRSKNIFIPSNIKIALNHMIFQFAEGRELNVQDNIGILHHYRGPCSTHDLVEEWNNDSPIIDQLFPSRLYPNKCLQQPNHIDRIIYRYKDILVNNVNTVLSQISDQCKFNSSVQNFK